MSDSSAERSKNRSGKSLSSSARTPIDEKVMAMRIVTMPNQTNPYGTIFGGIILSYIDQASFVEARRYGDLDWVTASVGKVEFHAPVHVGDIVTFFTHTTRLGRTSIDVQVEVEAERFKSHEVVHVTSANLTMVGMRDGKPIPFRECPCPFVNRPEIDQQGEPSQ